MTPNNGPSTSSPADVNCNAVPRARSIRTHRETCLTRDRRPTCRKWDRYGAAEGGPVFQKARERWTNARRPDCSPSSLEWQRCRVPTYTLNSRASFCTVPPARIESVGAPSGGTPIRRRQAGPRSLSLYSVDGCCKHRDRKAGEESWLYRSARPLFAPALVKCCS